MIAAKKIACEAVLIGLPLLMVTSSATANPTLEATLKQSLLTEKTPSQSSAKINFALNPNPNIFQEAPYNSSSILLAEKLRTKQGEASVNPDAESPEPSQGETPVNPDAESQEPSQSEVKPWSEAQENRIALVKAINGQFNIRLMNTTNTEVTYELVGHTNQRQLTGNTNFLLQDIAMPVTVTVLREDGGLIRVTPKPAAPGILELRLDEALNLDQDRRAVRVREGGSLLIY